MLDNPRADLDVEDACNTAALGHYVRQYTYIDYAADDWLDKLLYALPVRGLLHAANPIPDDTDDELLLDG